MSPSTSLQLKSYRLWFAFFLGSWGLILLAATIFHPQLSFWLKNHVVLSAVTGLVLLAGGVFLFTKSPSHEKSYTIRHVEGLNISYTPKAVSDAIASLFEELLPGKDVKKDVLFHKGSVHIFIDLPYHPEDQQKELLETIEKELRGMLHKLFGYNSDFLLVTSFQDSPS